MVRSLPLVLLLAATSASAAPLALPSFEGAAAELRANVAALRASALKQKSADIGPRLNQMAWDVERSQQDCSRLRRELGWLLSRLRNGRPGPGNGRGGPDQNLRWEFQRFNQDLARLSRDAQWRLSDLRGLSAEAQKDPALVAPAQRLSDSARWLKSETGWLASDARFAYFDLMRAGLTFEGMDLDRNSRDFDQSSQDLQSESDRLLAKVR